MRRLATAAAFATALAMTPFAAFAEGVIGTDWQLLAIDGLLVDFPATLQLDDTGRVSGKAPCNRYSGQNSDQLPDLKLMGLASTRMACSHMADEDVFFKALALMTRLELDGTDNLILTGPESLSMEFVADPTNNQTVCKTCPPAE
jgi:heat shock protein HslJ